LNLAEKESKSDCVRGGSAE